MNTKQIDEKAWTENPYTWRNNRGTAYTKNGQFIRFGIPEPRGGGGDRMKGGDRIGFKEIEITPDMVGKKIAVFLNIEIKGPGDTLKNGQIRWHNFILEHGGLSEIVYEDKKITGVIKL